MRHIFLLAFVLTACGTTARRIIYNEQTYDRLEKAQNVKVTFADGRSVQFHKMQIVKTDEQYVYARCWESKSGEPQDYKFLKSEIVIESSEFSSSRTVGYVAYLVLTVGVLFVLQRILYN